MPRRDEIGSVRFELVTSVRMIQVEPYDSSNVNDPRDRRENVTVIARKASKLLPQDVAGTVAAVLK